jgi:hypothetical protein
VRRSHQWEDLGSLLDRRSIALLYYSTRIDTLRRFRIQKFQEVSDESRLIVCRSASVGAWNEVPESTCAVIVGDGDDYLQPSAAAD